MQYFENVSCYWKARQTSEAARELISELTDYRLEILV